MITVKNILDNLAALAPTEAKMDFDNVGLLVGESGAEVTKILTALDITSEVIDEAIALGANLIVSHHPILFSTATVTDSTIVGRKLLALASNRIAAICMHTNLDAAHGGVNDALAAACGLINAELFKIEGNYADGSAFSYGRIGSIGSPMQLADYLAFVKNSLRGNGLRYHDAGRTVSRVAVVGGSGGSYLHDAVTAGCDTLVTSDVKYDVFLDARELGINLIDADHFCTENTVIPVVRARLATEFPGLDCVISARHCQTAQFF